MRLLLTGFEPFGGSPINPSEQIVRAFERQGITGVELETAILPVDATRGPAALLRAVKHARPDAILCLGEATRRPVLSIERVAVNLMDYRIADNAGRQIVDRPVVPGGPAAYFATLPVRAMHAAVAAAGVPCELSLTAGAYLCNQVLYVVLHHVAVKRSTAVAGFVHLPALPDQVVDRQPPIPSMSLDTAVRGVGAAIAAIVARARARRTRR